MELAPTAVLRPAPDLAIRRRGAVLIGGYPTRVLSLSPSGSDAVSAWFDGHPLGDLTAHRRLGWRLVAAGLADLGPCSDLGSLTSVTVVMPVKDDIGGAVRSLMALAGEN